MFILWMILFHAANFDLFETPLRQDSVRSGQVTPKREVSEPQSGRKRMHTTDMGTAALTVIVHDFDHPIIVRVSDGRITVARNFIVEFGDRRWDRM